MYFFLRLAIFSISPTSILTRDTTGNGSRNDCHRLLHLEAENVPEVGRQGDVLEADLLSKGKQKKREKTKHHVLISQKFRIFALMKRKIYVASN